MYSYIQIQTNIFRASTFSVTSHLTKLMKSKNVRKDCKRWIFGFKRIFELRWIWINCIKKEYQTLDKPNCKSNPNKLFKLLSGCVMQMEYQKIYFKNLTSGGLCATIRIFSFSVISKTQVSLSHSSRNLIIFSVVFIAQTLDASVWKR